MIAHRACMRVDAKTKKADSNVSVLRGGKARYVTNVKRLKVVCLSIRLGRILMIFQSETLTFLTHCTCDYAMLAMCASIALTCTATLCSR